jgi:hypothetical protein
VAVIDRLFTWIGLMLDAADQFLGCWLRGWFFVWFNGEQPDPDETISSWVGRAQRDGKRWGRIAAAVIDTVMGQGHCLKAIGK